MGTLVGTFEKYPPLTHWVKVGQIVSEPSMYSTWTHWAIDPLPPVYLNYGCVPSPMIWEGEKVYPGVCQFAKNMKDAIMSAHDAIITSRVQHTVQANRKRLPTTYSEEDLVYLSTKNISLPKG